MHFKADGGIITYNNVGLYVKEEFMEQNQNPQQPDMQNPQNYQYGYENQGQQINQTSPYNQQPANPYQQSANPYQQSNPYYQEYQKPMYSPVAVKKRVNPAVIIIPAAILAVAAAVVVLILIFSGSSGYKGAEGKYFSQMLGGLSSAVDETEKVSETPQSITISFDASNSEISDYIGISNITLKTETAVKGEDIFAQMSLAIGNQLVNGKIWLDKESSEVLMLLPEISSIYLKASVELDEAEQEAQIDPDKAMAAFNDIFSQTLETYFEVVGDPETQGSQTLRVAGESYTADKVEIKLNEVQVAIVVKAFLENLVDNDDAMDILCTIYGEDKEYVIETLDIYDVIEKLEDIIEENEESKGSLNMTVWMMSGNIVGREIELINNSGSKEGEIDFYQIPTSDGTLTYFEMPDEFKFVSKDSVKGDVHSGTVTISDGYDDITVEYEDLAVTDKLFQGKAKIVLSGSEAFEISAELSSEGETKTLLVSIPNVCRVTVTAEPSSMSFEDMPQPSGGQVAVISSDSNLYDDEAFMQFTEDLSNYLMSFGIF